MDLDVVSFVAALVTLAGVARHVRKPGNLPLQRHVTFRHTELERDAAQGLVTTLNGPQTKAQEDEVLRDLMAAFKETR